MLGLGIWLGVFGLGSLAWNIWVGILGLGNWAPEAGEPFAQQLGEPWGQFGLHGL